MPPAMLFDKIITLTVRSTLESSIAIIAKIITYTLMSL